MKRVLVLRPEPGASATAAALRALGFEPVVFPLAEVAPLDVPDIDTSGLTAVAATSANGVRHAPAALIASLRDRPFYAVGSATADAARKAGFSQVAVADGDGRALAALVAGRVAKGERLLYLCGHVRGADFEQELGAAGVTIVPVETYDVTYPDRTDAFRALLRDSPPPDAAMIHSPEAGRAFARLLDDTGRPLRRLNIVAISHRAAEPLSAFDLRASIAARPDEAAMLDALSRIG